MTISEALEALALFIDRFKSEPPSEDTKSFVVSGNEWPEDAIDAWRSMQCINAWLAENNLGESLLGGQVSGPVDFGAEAASIDPGDRWSYSINKNLETRGTFFLDVDTFRDNLRTADLSAIRMIRVRDDFEPFTTYGLAILPLLPHGAAPAIEEWKGEDDPRQIVRILSSGVALPHSVAFWLPHPPAPSDDSRTYRAWRAVTIEKLALMLPHEILKGATLEAIIKGPRKLSRTIETRGPSDQDLLDMLAATVRWVYESSDQLNSRHDLLMHHLVVEWTDCRTWIAGLATHLEEARRNAGSPA